jgi:carbon storage regulator
MLVLTRKQGEKIRIGDDVVITVVRTKGKAVRLGIQAPTHVPVLRGEIAIAIAGERQQPVCESGDGPPEVDASDGEFATIEIDAHANAHVCCASSATVPGRRGPLRELLDARC